MYPLPLTAHNLTLPKEKTYYNILLVFSILCWLLVVISLVGLIYGVLVIFLVWLANGLLIARLKSESVEVTEAQIPELYKTFQEACEQLNIKRFPKLYLLQSDGILNAFATRFSGRDFVVIYSSIYEAFGDSSPQIRFLIGHELGHVLRKHLFKHALVSPGLFLPLVGAAYRRACEATCDRYGAFVSGDFDGSIIAMMTLSGGKEASLKMDSEAFVRQYYRDRGFFISWHELNSGYPTLSQRTAYLQAIKNNHLRPRPPRDPLAYILAFFSTGAPILIVVIYLALISAVFIPGVQQAFKAAQHIKQLPATGTDSAFPASPNSN